MGKSPAEIERLLIEHRKLTQHATEAAFQIARELDLVGKAFVMIDPYADPPFCLIDPFQQPDDGDAHG